MRYSDTGESRPLTCFKIMEKQNSIEIWSGLSLNDRAACEGDARRRKKIRETVIAKAENTELKLTAKEKKTFNFNFTNYK